MSHRRQSAPPPAIRASAVPARRSRLLAVAVLVLAAALVVGIAAVGIAADPPPGSILLTPAEVSAAGLDMAVTEEVVGDHEIVEVELSPGDAADGRELLDVAPDGTFVAVTDELTMEPGTVSVRHPDGSIMQIELPGILDAAFALDGSWLAALDGHGDLLRIDHATGVVEPLAEGPFTGPIRFAPDGTLLLRSVSSVEAPFIAELVRHDPASGEAVRLSGDELVYEAFVLGDGSIAYSAHERGGGTVVMRVAPGGPELLADLGPSATQVDVAVTGAIAFVVDEGVYLIDEPGGTPRLIAAGADPSFSPDGRELLVSDAGSTTAIGLDGSVITQLDAGDAAWTCSEGCEE